MLLLIGLQSGKGLHPDRIFKLPRLPKTAEIGSPISSCLQVKVSQFSLFGNLAVLANVVLSLPLFMF
ncbi:MAG TPA: hypothetical protein VHW72_20510 [Candidatus Angelobacter sp.]|jgi:hypothetical protein|nr:hypothetical protein [Candidatus Angelobacter sp.]